MFSRNRFLFWPLMLLMIIIALLGGMYFLNSSKQSPPQKPVPDTPRNHAYISILDEATGEVLMDISVEVNIGDELITDKNMRYTIVKIEDTRAYARFVADLTPKIYRQPSP